MRAACLILIASVGLGWHGLHAQSSATRGDRYSTVPQAPAVVESGPLAIGEETEVRMIPVADLLEAPVSCELPRLGRALGERAWNGTIGWTRSEDGDRSRELFPKSPSRRRERSLDRADAAWGELEVSSANGNAVLVGKKADLDRLEALARYFASVEAPRYRLDFAVVDDASLPVGPLGASGAQLLDAVIAGKRGKLIDFGTVEGRVGDEVQAGVERHVTIQGELDVEIAQEATAFDPIMIPVRAGRVLTCSGVLSPQGELVLFGLYSDRSVDRASSIAVGENESVQGARVRQSQQAFSIRAGLHQGIALATSPGRRTARRLLLRATRVAGSLELDAGRRALQVGLLRELRLVPTWGEQRKAAPHIDSVTGLLDRDGPDTKYRLCNQVLHVTGAPATLDRAEKIVDYFARDLTRQFEVRLVREARVGDEWRPFGLPVSLYCLGGRTGFSLDGEERLAVTDYEVEVAQKASVGDPLISACFDGIEAFAYVTCSVDGCDVSLRVSDCALRREVRVAAPAKHLGRIETPVQDVVRIDRVLRMKPGGSQTLGRLPTREVTGQLREIRLRVELHELGK